MAERVQVRERAVEPAGGAYNASMARTKTDLDRWANGKVVVTVEDHPWEITPMGRYMYYLHDMVFEETCLSKWRVFLNDIKIHSGAHRHQGGIAIYVTEGSGYTVVEGIREEWEAGDLILIPITPGGIEHQHFNNVPGQPCKWVAFMYMPAFDALVSDQVVTSPPKMA